MGVEFGGTAVSSSGYGSNITQGNAAAELVVGDNPELQWAEGYFRASSSSCVDTRSLTLYSPTGGYFQLHITPEELQARFFGVPTVAERHALELSMANFTVRAGENRLSRPLSGGKVEAGCLRGGEVEGTNLTVDTETGEWAVRGFERMFLEYEDEE